MTAQHVKDWLNASQFVWQVLQQVCRKGKVGPLREDESLHQLLFVGPPDSEEFGITYTAYLGTFVVDCSISTLQVQLTAKDSRTFDVLHHMDARDPDTNWITDGHMFDHTNVQNKIQCFFEELDLILTERNPENASL